MTPIVKPYEFVEYRNESLELVCNKNLGNDNRIWPLQSILETKNLIGYYEAKWKIMDSKFYLKELINCDKKIKDNFDLSEPLLAYWIDGTLELGLGEQIETYGEKKYNYHLLLHIEKGIILDKKIIKNFSLSFDFNFGKYKGQEFADVLYGKFRFETHYIVTNYIKSVLDFITKSDYDKKIICPYFEITEKDIETVKYAREYGIEYFLTHTYIAVGSQSIYDFDTDKPIINISSRVSEFLEKILTSNFSTLRTINKKGAIDKVSDETILINNDIQYINWAIKNVEKFIIHPKLLSNPHEIRKIKTFKTKRLNNSVFEFKPIFSISTFNFSDDIQQKNIEKFNQINNVIFERDLGAFLVNLNEKELMNEFGYYLDENFTKQIEYRDEFSYDDYHYDRNNWLVDAAGTDDPEVMNDVYWNLD